MQKKNKYGFPMFEGETPIERYVRIFKDLEKLVNWESDPGGVGAAIIKRLERKDKLVKAIKKKKA